MLLPNGQNRFEAPKNSSFFRYVTFALELDWFLSPNSLGAAILWRVFVEILHIQQRLPISLVGVHRGGRLLCAAKNVQDRLNTEEDRHADDMARGDEHGVFVVISLGSAIDRQGE